MPSCGRCGYADKGNPFCCRDGLSPGLLLSPPDSCYLFERNCREGKALLTGKEMKSASHEAMDVLEHAQQRLNVRKRHRIGPITQGCVGIWMDLHENSVRAGCDCGL
jgi:hypothetical protein